MWRTTRAGVHVFRCRNACGFADRIEIVEVDDIRATDMCGWANQFPIFRAAALEEIVNALTNFVQATTPEHIRTWKSYIPPLQRQCGVVLDERSIAQRYCAILEYRMPDGSKRVDAILLLSGAVLIVEMKGDGNWQPEYREQAADYARRLFLFSPLLR